MRWVVVALAAWAGTAAAQGVDRMIGIRSDLMADYYVLEISMLPNGNRKIVTRRDAWRRGADGGSRTSFSIRELDCRRGQSRYLASADTLQDALAQRPREQMNRPVEGSIADVVARAGCARPLIAMP